MRSRVRWMVVLILLGGSTGLEATDRVGVQFNTYLSYTNNLFQNYNRRSDWVTLAYADVNYAWRRSMSFYYTGNANVFAEYGDLFSHTHQVGFSYTRPGKHRNALFAGVEANLRLDRPVYRYYDYFQQTAYLNGKFYLRPSLLSWVGYRLRYRQYLHAEEYSYMEQAAFLKFSRFLKTRTTLQVQGNFGVKTYARSISADTSDAVSRARAGGARTLAQATLGAKVAQALAKNTGLQIEYLLRINVIGQNRFAEVEGFNTDEELFDDRYSYDENELRSTLKHLTPWGVQVEVTGRYVQRDYLGRPALDLNGFLIRPDLTRQDTRKSVELEVEKTFRFSKGWVREVGVRVEWLYKDIRSNDSYYDTDVQVFSAGLQAGF
ncbi:MAG: hypothetical protein O2954_09190 [bacterium]|nr:hypothetical protein [bacterium]